MPNTQARPKPFEETIRLERLGEYGILDGFEWPSGKLSSHQWELTYLISIFDRHPDPPQDWGYFTLRRQPAKEINCFDLSVTAELGDLRAGWQRSDAVITCREDSLATPLRWQCTSQAWRPGGVKIDVAGQSMTGRVAGKQIVLSINGCEIRKPAPARLSSTYGLFAAMMGGHGEAEQGEFALLDDFTMIKPDQKLARLGKRPFSHGGTTKELRRVCHTGRGVLPFEYWLDDTGRVVFSFSDFCCFVLCPDAARRSRQSVDSRAAKGGRNL